MQQHWYFCQLTWWEAICNAGVGVSDSCRQGISTPPTPHADEMCFTAKLCSFKQEIMCTLFREKKKLMKMCLLLLFSLWPQWRLKGGLCHYQIWITVSAHTKIPQRAQYCLLWAASERCTRLAVVPLLCEQPEPHRSSGNHSGDHTHAPLVLSQAGLGGTLAAAVTGTAQHGQDTHSQDRSVQVWAPAK